MLESKFFLIACFVFVLSKFLFLCPFASSRSAWDEKCINITPCDV